MKENPYLTYEELKNIPLEHPFDESFVKKNYKYLMDIHDMIYCGDGTVLLWVGRYRVDVTGLYNEGEKKEMKYHQMYLNDLAEERHEEERLKMIKNVNDCQQKLFDEAIIVNSMKTINVWDLKLSDYEGFSKYCYDKAVYGVDRFIDSVISEETRGGGPVKWFVRYFDGTEENYDPNNSYHKQVYDYIFFNH
jgi:hypothetical protein